MSSCVVQRTPPDEWSALGATAFLPAARYPSDPAMQRATWAERL